MKNLLSVIQSAKLGVLAILIFAVLGLRFIWGTVDGAFWFHAHLGYYTVLSLLIIWGVFLLHQGTQNKWFSWEYWRKHFPGLCAVFCVSVFLHIHEPHAFRVMHDEPSHALLAMGMHLEKQALGAGQSNYIGDCFMLTEYNPTFRQYLFPLLVSLMHDFTGYRLANVFILNAIFTALVLLITYLISYKLGGKLAGALSVIMLGSLPLFSQVVTSGEYDVLNLALLGSLVLFVCRYVEAADCDSGPWMNLSLATALLLAVARTESILYLLLWAIVTGIVWWRQRKIRLTWFAAFSPVFVLPNILTNLLVLRTGAGMDLELRRNGEAFFALDYIPRHLSEAIYYFLNPSYVSTNSPLLAGLGIIGIVALLVRVTQAFRQNKTESQEWILCLFVIWVAGIYLFILANFWGSPADVLAARFSLPLMFVCAVTAGWFLVQFAEVRRRPVLLITGLVLWIVLYTAPTVSRAFLTYGSTTTRAEEWFLRYAASRDQKSSLYIAKSNVSFIVRGYASSRLEYLNRSPATFVRAVKAGLYKDIIVFQPMFGDPKTGAWVVPPLNKAADNIILETIDERIFTPMYKARIARLVGYKKADGTLVGSSSSDPEVAIRMAFPDQAEWYKYYYSLYP